MNEGDNGKTPPTSPHKDHYEGTINFCVKTSVKTSHIEVMLGKTPTIKTDGSVIFDSSDLDNFLLINDLKKGEIPKFICKALAEEIGSTPEEVSKAYADAVNDAKQSLGADTLNPDAWFTGENEARKFVPHLCAKDYLRAYPHVVTEYSGLIHQFTGTHWLRDAEGVIYSTIENAGKGLIRPRQISEAVESLRNQTRIIDPDKLNLTMEQILPMPPHSIPIENGILNLLDKTIQPFSPDFYYMEVLPRNYIPGAVPEVFIEFLNKIFLGDLGAELKITQIFEIIAWTLMMNYDIQGAVVLYGQGGEGKSVVHNIIADTIVHTTSISLSELEQDRFKRAELSGSWANLVSESSSNIVISDWFKRLTDGTTITAERKNQHPFQFSSHAKLILDVNELPIEEGQLRAFYRRVPLIIDFPNMLENVLSPQEIDEFVKKLKEPEELDRIFSYVVDNFYAPLVTRMKFTGHLSIADAEKKWTERSNPALTYIQMKHEDGEIYTDVEDVKALLQDNPTLVFRYITTDKGDGTEYLTMVKTDVISAARKWASERGFPAKTIDGTSLGKALVSLGYSNETVNKRINKTTFLRAWKGIFINISEGTSDGHVTGHVTSDGHVTGHENHPPQPQNQSNTEENKLCDGGRFLRSVSFSKNEIIKEDLENTRHINSKILENTEENPVTGDFGHPSHDRHTTLDAYNSESSADIVQPSVQSEKNNQAPEKINKDPEGKVKNDQFDIPEETLRKEIINIIIDKAPLTEFNTLTPKAIHDLLCVKLPGISLSAIYRICKEEYDKGTLSKHGPGYRYNGGDY